MWGQIVATAWKDESFKKRLLANPAAIFKEQGLEMPAGMQIHVVENTDEVLHLILPARPREAELNDDELTGVSGGRLDVGMVIGLAKVFGWSNKQRTDIFDADNPPPKSPSGTGHITDRSPPGSS